MAKKLNFDAKEDVLICSYLDVTDEENLRVVSSISENDKYDAMKDEELPENIMRVKSWWKRPTFGLSQLIEMNQYVDKVNPQTKHIERVYDYNALTIARIRVLLKRWSLDDVDVKYKLTFERAMENAAYNVLSANAMTMLLNIEPPELIMNLYNKMLLKLIPDDPYSQAISIQREAIKKAEEEAKKQTGEVKA